LQCPEELTPRDLAYLCINLIFAPADLEIVRVARISAYPRITERDFVAKTLQ